MLHSRQRRVVVTSAGVLVAIILGSYLADSLYQTHLSRNWDSIAAAEQRTFRDEVQSRFTAYQQRTLAATDSIARSSQLLSALRVRTDSARAGIFRELTSHDRMNLSFELYNDQQQLIAWSGTHSSTLDSTLFEPFATTSILPGPILSYFVVIVPFNLDEKQYHLVGKRLFDVNYPISNRFISNQAFATTFTSRFRAGLDFNISPITSAEASDRFSIPLVSLRGDTLGYAVSQAPLLAESRESVEENFGTVISISVILLCGLLLYVYWKIQGMITSPVFRVILWTFGLWTYRYIMVWRNFPQCLTDSSLFEASYFASPFGFGLAKSVGDMCISALFLLATVLIIVSPWMAVVRDRERAIMFERRKLLSSVVPVVSLIMLFVILRGFFATISSAVLDSSLPYDDPTYVLPSMELMTMLVGLLALAIALIVLAIAVSLTCHASVSLNLLGGRESFGSWAVTIGCMVVLGLVFGTVYPSPLLSQLPRALYVILFGALALIYHRTARHSQNPFVPRLALLLLLSALFLVIPSVDKKVHELDRIHTELLAAEVLRPSETWIKIEMQRALDELSNGEATTVLETGGEESVKKLAFTQWAKSILSRQGNDCAIVFFDRSGKIVSSFQMGISPFRVGEPFVDISPTHRYLDTEERSETNEKHIMGYTPIYAQGGEMLGGVWVELAAGRTEMLPSESSNLLGNYSTDRHETQFRRLTVSEYLRGRLLSTTNDLLPRDHRLPPAILDAKDPTIWVDETIDGMEYETLYAKEQNKSSDVVWAAFRMNSLDLRWHMFSYLRYCLFYVLLSVVVGCLYLLSRLIQGGSIFGNFRMKLMAAFMFVSVLPILVLAYYNRQYVVERFQEATQKRLNDQTELVLSSVQREFGVNAPFSLSVIDDRQCVSLSERIHEDFIVYSDKFLQASSKPEIFTAELLDRRLSPEAFVNIVLKRKNFYLQNRSIGNYPYVVGYRPITAENGAIIGVVSVPTLFRQGEIDEELTQRNVLLFGAYALALLLSLGVGTVFANQISSPILRLKNATKRLAEGDWNVRFLSGRKDELGELEHSFEEMTRELKESQEQMLAVQREAAWKEMAKQVAHEIKNPLTPIKLSIQHLRRAYTDNVKEFGDVLEHVSSTILQQIETLTRIASEFSHFARMPERTLTYCDVHEILNEAKNLFAQQTSVKFETDYRAQKSVIYADREELRRAFINIIRNGIQAMKEKGSVTLCTASDVDILEVRLADTGPGIPAEIKDRLFEPNFSTKTDGMGLGLALVKKTVEDLGGTITIDSTPGKGTTVTMKLLLSLEHE